MANTPDVFYCQTCANYFFNGTCAAFVDGIPYEILKGEAEHTKPIIGQENDIVFEPVNNSPEAGKSAQIIPLRSVQPLPPSQIAAIFKQLKEAIHIGV